MTGAARLALAAVVLMAVAAAGARPARAEFWTGFYRSSAPAAAPRPAAQPPADRLGEAACLTAILDAQKLYGIPDNLLLAIGIQEAGRKGPKGLTVWPWTVNADGEGVFFATRQEAQDWVRAKQAAGVTSIDVGCMQVNQKWHGHGFASLEQAFEPSANVDYAARFLLRLYRDEGDWWQAAGKYHSSTKKFQDIYLASLQRNQRAATANLASFLDRAQPAFAGGDTRTAALPAAPRAPMPPVFWSSASSPGSAEQGEARFSIYSNQPIRPVLPRYRDMF